MRPRVNEMRKRVGIAELAVEHFIRFVEFEELVQVKQVIEVVKSRGGFRSRHGVVIESSSKEVLVPFHCNRHEFQKRFLASQFHCVQFSPVHFASSTFAELTASPSIDVRIRIYLTVAFTKSFFEVFVGFLNQK